MEEFAGTEFSRVRIPTNEPLVTGSVTAGSTRYWCRAVHARAVIVDTGERRLPLRHSHHRYTICGPNGVQHLTIPITGDTHNASTAMRDVRISEHANWRRVHWGALYSAYGKTPYFDYVADDLQSIISGSQHFLLDFNMQMQQLIIHFMALPVTITYIDTSQAPVTAAECPAQEAESATGITDVPYYQPWAAKHGFVAGLSIIDMMMCLGPEAIITLMQMKST